MIFLLNDQITVLVKKNSYESMQNDHVRLSSFTLTTNLKPYKPYKNVRDLTEAIITDILKANYLSSVTAYK